MHPQTSFHTPPIFPPRPRKRPPPPRSRSPSPTPTTTTTTTPARHTLHAGPRPPTATLTHLTAHALPPAPLPPTTLRQRHLATLTTLLHHALATNDLARASRAYALLLRTPTTDIRAFWRPGAELLLRRGDHARAVELLARLALAYPYNKGTHALHSALSAGEEGVRWGGIDGGGEEAGKMVRPSVLEFVPALLEVLVLVGEGVEARERVWERVEGWMVGPPWAEMAVLWGWRAGVAAWCADGAGGAEEAARWRGEEERAWRGYVQRGGVVPEVARRGRGGQGSEGEEEDDDDDEEEVVG
ncbi:hypothetical protein DFP73DRAFT_616619 [Morchella snyderi]|nr:hypothetical protein DFP73DRAFT_616619 [Morchella snyderi]